MAAPAMQIDRITALEELEALRPDWEWLWQRCPAAGPFQHPDWLIAWWRHLGGGELRALAFHEGAELVGVAPFYVHRDDRRGLRQLTLLGNGVSDTLDVLVVPGAEATAAAVREFVAGDDGGWNAVDLRDLPPHSPLLAMAAGRRGLACEADAPHAVIDLNAAGPDGAGLMSQKFRSNLRQARRQAERRGEVRITRADASDAQPQLDVLFALHRARWQQREQQGVLADAGVQGFHREVAVRFAARGWLRQYVLQIGERIVGAYYGFSLRGRSYHYIGGFDPQFQACSPGALLLQHALRDAITEGAEAFDLLRGRESYKYRWGAVDRPQYRLRGQFARQQ